MQSRYDQLLEKLNYNSKDLNLGCVVTKDNVNDLVVLKKSGLIVEKKYAKHQGLDCFESKELQKALRSYFDDSLDEDSEGIKSLITFEVLKTPVILCPKEGQVAGTILEHSEAQQLVPLRDPNTRGEVEKWLKIPVIHFLIAHMQEQKQQHKMGVQAKHTNNKKTTEELFFDKVQQFLTTPKKYPADEFRCPITNKIFQNPVLTNMGLYVEQAVAHYVLCGQKNGPAFMVLDKNTIIDAGNVIKNYAFDGYFSDKLGDFLNNQPQYFSQQFNTHSPEAKHYHTPMPKQGHAKECYYQWSQLQQEHRNKKQPVIITSPKIIKLEDKKPPVQEKSQIVQRKNRPEYDYLFKMRIVGDSGVGKSSLLLRFADNSYTESFISTIGVDFKNKTIPINGDLCNLQIWDTAGQERFRTITSNYYRGPHAYLFCFDVTNPETFNNLQKWILASREESSEHVCNIVVGTKTDLIHERKVGKEEAEDFCAQLGLNYIETSAKDNFQIEALFQSITLQILTKLDEKNSLYDHYGRDFGKAIKHIPPSLSAPVTQAILEEENKPSLVSIIKTKVEEKFGKLDEFGIAVGGQYSGKMDDSRKELRKQLLTDAKQLTENNLEAFIEKIQKMAASAQAHHKSESGGFFSSFTTSGFKKHVDEIVDCYEEQRALGNLNY